MHNNCSPSNHIRETLIINSVGITNHKLIITHYATIAYHLGDRAEAASLENGIAFLFNDIVYQGYLECALFLEVRLIIVYWACPTVKDSLSS